MVLWLQFGEHTYELNDVVAPVQRTTLDWFNGVVAPEWHAPHTCTSSMVLWLPCGKHNVNQ